MAGLIVDIMLICCDLEVPLKPIAQLLFSPQQRKYFSWSMQWFLEFGNLPLNSERPQGQQAMPWRTIPEDVNFPRNSVPEILFLAHCLWRSRGLFDEESEHQCMYRRIWSLSDRHVAREVFLCLSMTLRRQPRFRYATDEDLFRVFPKIQIRSTRCAELDPCDLSEIPDQVQYRIQIAVKLI